MRQNHPKFARLQRTLLLGNPFHQPPDQVHRPTERGGQRIGHFTKTSYRGRGQSRGERGKALMHTKGDNCPQHASGNFKQCPSTHTTSISRKVSKRDTIRRKIKKLHTPLGNNTRSFHTKHDVRLGNPLLIKPKTNRVSQTNKHELQRKIISVEGNREHVGEGCHSTSTPQGGSIYKQHFSKKAKHLHSLPPFQNGGTEESERYLASRGPDVQTGPKRCIFYGSNRGQVEKVPQVPLGRKLVRVSVPLLWTGPSTQTVHQTNESPHNFTQKVTDKAPYLPRRYAPAGVNPPRNKHGQGYHNLPSTESGVCDKLREVNLDSLDQGRISWSDNKQCRDDINSARGKSGENCKSVPKNTVITSDVIKGTIKSNRAPEGNNTSHYTCSNSNKVPSEPPNNICSEPAKLRMNSNPKQGLQNRIKLVGRESKTTQWETDNHCTTRMHNPIRCSDIRGLGSSMPKYNKRGTLATRGEEPPYKHLRTESCQSSHTDLHKNEKSLLHTHTDRQYNGLVLPDKDGRDKKQGIDRDCQGNMGLSSVQRDHPSK